MMTHAEELIAGKRVVSQSRRGFLVASAAAGGGFLLGFALPGFAAAGPAAADSDDAVFAPNAFIRIDRHGIVTFVPSRVEMGQGVYTSISMLIAEELEVDLASVRIEHAPADDALYGDPLLREQITGGSLAIRGTWEPMRRAGAVGRSMLIAAAAQTWGVAPASCKAENGVVRHTPTGRTLSYGRLASRAAELPVPDEKTIVLKDPKDFKLIGTPAKRMDSPDKVRGRTQFGIDVRFPGMGIATVAACPVAGGKVRSVDDRKALAVKGVREVIRIEDAVAVVADHMWAAKQGLAALDVQWAEGDNASFSNAVLIEQMEAASRHEGVVAKDIGDARAELTRASTKVDAIYQQPFLAHTAMEPINCTVELTATGCDIWTGSQVPARAQALAAAATGLPREQVRVHNQYLGGGFGRRLEADYVEQAARFARQSKAKGPVKFVWTREEDVQQDRMRPYFYDRVSAALDANGLPSAWTHRIVGGSVMARFMPMFVVKGVDLDAVDIAADLPYSIPNIRVDYVRHEPPVPTGNWRGVGPTHNVFVVESFMDELAASAGRDPVEYRRTLLDKSPRAKAVVDLAAEKAGWGKPLPSPANGVRTGRGISLSLGFGSFLSQVAEIAVSPQGEVSVTRVVCAVDCGQAINPDTIRAQVEGGLLYGLSAVLWGEITFRNGRVEQTNFHDYRALRMNEAPRVEIYLIESRESPGGMGEAGTAALFPAVTNAVFAATGVRVRTLPIDPEQLRTA